MKGGESVSQSRAGGEPHYAYFDLYVVDGLLRVEPKDVCTRGSRWRGGAALQQFKFQLQCYILGQGVASIRVHSRSSFALIGLW